MVDFGAGVDQQEPETGDSCLHTAVMGNNKEVMEYLLSLNPTVNLRNNQGTTPLYSAVMNANIGWARALLHRGAKTNIKGFVGWSPLIFAAEHRGFEMIRLLLANGADPNDRSQYGTVLHHAVEMKNLDTVELLLKAGASPLCKERSSENVYPGKLPFELAKDWRKKRRILEYAFWIFKRANPAEKNCTEVVNLIEDFKQRAAIY